jgi:hypothetical protein
MARARTDLGIFEVSLSAVVSALDKIYPAPLVWADDAGALYRKAKAILESGDDMEEDHIKRKYLAEGYTDGEVMALGSLVEAMATESTSETALDS